MKRMFTLSRFVSMKLAAVAVLLLSVQSVRAAVTITALNGAQRIIHGD